MLTRVKRKISKQLSHENISEKANSPEESPGRKHSTVERKQSTAERNLSKAERKRSTAEKRHARSKSLESSTDPDPEVQYLMYEIQGLQAEVNTLKVQLEEEAKRSQELKNLKTQQVCALTFKLASAIRQREIAEENAEKAKAELEELQSKMINNYSCNSCLRVIAPSEKQEVIDKLRKISEESDSSLEVDENEKEDHYVPGNGDSESFNASVRRSSRKSGVAITPDDLEKLMEGQGRGPNENGYLSFSGEDISGETTICDVETQTLPPEDQRTVVDQETQCDSSQESSSPDQMDQDILSQEFCRIQEELGEVRGNMSMVHALNQRLSEDLQTFTKNYEQRQCDEEEGSNEIKSSGDQSSVAVSFRSSLSHPRSNKVDHRIGDPQVESQTCAEKPITLQIADEKYAEREWLERFGDEKVWLRKVGPPQEVKETQVVKPEEVRDSAIGTDLQQFGREPSAGIDEDLVGFTTEVESPETATAEQMKLVKEQLQIAMMEIDQLRSDNKEMKRELRKISENDGNELLVKTTRYTDQLLREMKQREASTRSRVSSCSSDVSCRYPFALVDNFDRETDDVFLPEKITPTQCPQLKAQPGRPHVIRGSEQRSRPSLPLRCLGNRLQEMTETLDDMTEQEPLHKVAQDPPVLDPFIRPVSPCFAPQYQPQRLALAAVEPILGSKGGAFDTPAKLGERGIHSSSGALIVEKVKSGGLLDEERSKPLDFSRAIKNSYTLRDSRKPFSATYTNDYIQRHIVRSSDYIAKLRDLRPEELGRPQED